MFVYFHQLHMYWYSAKINILCQSKTNAEYGQDLMLIHDCHFDFNDTAQHSAILK